MPKHESLTPKAIANRIKAKGLQKLRWYCQMCQKQCRDENGFKCHTMSESHQRQLLLFAESPDKYIDHFSEEFLEGFIELLSRRFGTKRVHANQVYQEYISDRNHLHMNATQWETLTEFVKWLGREGYCVVDQTEKGWFISYIDRDPETIRRQEALAKKEKMDKDDEERMAKFLQKQIEKAKDKMQAPPESVYTECKKESEDEKVAFAVKQKNRPEPKLADDVNPLLKAAHSKSSSERDDKKKKELHRNERKRLSALDELIKEEEIAKEKINRKDYWLATGIVVKIISKKLSEKYYKKKGFIKEVVDKYIAVVKLIETGDVLKLDQAHIETVIPALGRKVMVVNGAYRGSEATLLEIKPEKFCAKIEICSGVLRGRIIDNLSYEDISKVHNQS